MVTTSDPPARLRAVEDRDAPGLVDLIARCFAEYPGCILDCETEETALLTPARSFETFWVAETADSLRRIVGCIGCAAGEDVDGTRGLELKKLYVHPNERRRGLGRRLIRLVEERARSVPSRRVFLWSDARFTTAHTVYERGGYVRSDARRELDDVSKTVEFHFARTLPDAGGVGGAV